MTTNLFIKKSPPDGNVIKLRNCVISTKRSAWRNLPTDWYCAYQQRCEDPSTTLAMTHYLNDIAPDGGDFLMDKFAVILSKAKNPLLMMGILRLASLAQDDSINLMTLLT